MYDVTVIGAGVIGGMIARKLSSFDMKVCILEREHDVAMGASRANSAIVHAGFDAKENSLKAKFNVEGSEMMEKTAAELGVKYKRNGSLVVGFNDEDREMLHQLLLRGKANGVRGLKMVEGEELFSIEPNLSKNVVCALYAPTGAIVCPYELTVASVGNAMDNGAELKLDFEVKSISKIPEGYEICSDKESVKSRFVINAAGVYSDKIAQMVGDNSFDVHPRRGEYILLDKECGGLVNTTVFRTPSKMGKGILVTPTVDGNLLLGPTSEDMTDKEDKSTSASGLSKIIKEAGENIDGIPFNKTVTSFCGLRAVGSTGDFIINAPIPGFINVAGIESPGLTASPAIAEHIAKLLEEQGADLKPREDYNPRRTPAHAFRDAGIDEKNEMIKRDKSFGRIICRCEEITEGEIIAAIRTNPGARDLDGVKRRTRAQMGRCQGGFCSPQITEIISRELGIPYEEVTKSGGNSRINISKTKGGADI